MEDRKKEREREMEEGRSPRQWDARKGTEEEEEEEKRGGRG